LKDKSFKQRFVAFAIGATAILLCKTSPQFRKKGSFREAKAMVIKMNGNIEMTAGSAVGTEEKKDNRFSAIDVIYAAAAFVFGYFLIKMFLFEAAGAGATVLSVLFTAASELYVYRKGFKIKLFGHFVIASVALFGLSYILYDLEAMLKTLVTVYIIAASAYFYLVAFGNSIERVPGKYIFFDYVKAVFIMPFASFGTVFSSVTSPLGRLGGKKIGFAAAGLLFAVIPTVVITVALNNADDAFGALVKELFDFSDIGVPLACIVLGLPIAMYIFGMVYGNSKKRGNSAITEAAADKTAQSIRIIPGSAIYSAATPILVIYILFFVSQSAYFLSGFADIVPVEFSAAEYARKGFFELCFVAVSNLAIICGLYLFARRSEKNVVLKIYITVYSLFTVAFISIAASKMVMYMSRFGLTRLRVYTTWFMLFLAVLFVSVIIKQFVQKFSVVKTVLAVGFVMLSLLVFSNVDVLIAKYNYESYKAGKIEEFDAKAILDLSDSAVSYLLTETDEYNKKWNKNDRLYTNAHFRHRRAENLCDNYLSYNFASAAAAKALEECLGIE